MKNIGTKTLDTDRLILRRINEHDYKQAYKNWCSHEEVTKYVIWSKHKDELETKELFDNWIKDYESNTTYRWIIELKENHEVIGTITASKKFIEFGTVSIGYCMSDDYWNRGIMTEALTRVIEFFFEECNADIICAEYLENNPASGKVMIKSGMKYDGIERKRVLDKNGKRNDLIVYSILREEYEENKRKNKKNN